MASPVELDSDGGVWRLVLSDPDRRNVMGASMAEAVLAAVRRVADDDGARALVVSGRGTAFCAGADLPELFGDISTPTVTLKRTLASYYRAFDAVRDLEVPTIAAVAGPAVGAGLNLALACDHRIVGPEASFGATFARIGLHPGGGCVWMLARLVGRGRALRTLLLGETVDARTAVELGIADECVDDPVAAAVDLAQRYARVDGDLARHIKRALDLAVGQSGLAESMAFESWAQADSARSPEMREWVARFAR